jgi:predicted metalloprotease with PDZ domain
MLRSALSGIALVVLAACAEASSQSSSTIRYAISFENRAHHEAEITVSYADLPAGTLELRMSRSSPGRYALHEFAKNVYDVRVTGADGAQPVVSRPNPHQWDVSGHGGAVTVTYALYGDHADGTYVGIDRSHAHLNMPATFMWARGLDDRPIELTVEIPEGSGWRVATQLASTDDPNRFTAPTLAYFLDSPTEVSDYWERRWAVGDADVGVALHHAGTDADAEQYADAVQAIVSASRDVYGELAPFDFGRYTFLACYLPWVDGDGMEHRNSTVLASTGSLASNMIGLLGTVAHEFFHSWNVERIRPATLEPFDFEEANMSRELWFAEGFTSYYDDLILWRADLIDDDEFASRVGGIANSVVNSRGRGYFSAVEMSMQAPFVDAATSVDPNNRQNTFLSYYTWGSGIALGLDLTLRTRFPGNTLDHLMREMWTRHGITEIPYTVEEIEAALTDVTGDAAFAADFFDRYVRGTEAPDFGTLLAHAGIELGLARPDQPWLGQLAMRFEDGAATMLGTPLEDTPLYEAGVDRGDRIVSIDGTGASGRSAVDEVLGAHAPGDQVVVRYESRGGSFEQTVTLTQDPELSASLVESGAEAVAFREGWRGVGAG